MYTVVRIKTCGFYLTIIMNLNVFIQMYFLLKNLAVEMKLSKLSDTRHEYVSVTVTKTDIKVSNSFG